MLKRNSTVSGAPSELPKKLTAENTVYKGDKFSANFGEEDSVDINSENAN